jgi:hypothetical protein
MKPFRHTLRRDLRISLNKYAHGISPAMADEIVWPLLAWIFDVRRSLLEATNSPTHQ